MSAIIGSSAASSQRFDLGTSGGRRRRVTTKYRRASEHAWCPLRRVLPIAERAQNYAPAVSPNAGFEQDCRRTPW